MSTVLVTGSAGFIGGYVVEELLRRGHTVVGLDNESKYGSISHTYDDHPNYRYTRGDAQDTDLVVKLLSGCEHFIAGAALIGGISYFHTYAYDLLAAGSLYISSLSSSGVHAMALSLPIGMAVAYFLQMVSGALRWVTLKVAGPLMADIVTGPNAPSSLHPAEVIVFVGRAFSLTLVPLLLWFGFVNHRSSERTVRRIFQQAAAIALLIMTGIILAGGVLAFYELRSR